MKRLVLAVIAVLALVGATPANSDAQVRVSVGVGFGPRHWHRHSYGYAYGGYGYRIYTPHAYYRSYHYGYPRALVVRRYRPAPVVVIRRSYHRGYRRW